MKKMRRAMLEGKKIFVGLEDSKKTWHVNVRYEHMEIHQASMPADYGHLKRYFENYFPGCAIRVMYEAGFKGFELHDKLQDDGITCVVTPASKVTEPKVNRVKTDRRDARRLAKNLENGDYIACWVPDRKRREDREVSRTYEQVKKDICRMKNRIRGMLKFHGLEGYNTLGAWGDRKYLSLRQLELPESLAFSLHMKLDTLEYYFRQRIMLRTQLKVLSKKPRYRAAVQAKQSCPGIGWLTAIRLTLEWGDLHRFKDGKSIASFSGLTASEYSTGETVHRGRITGQSAVYIRGWLIQCAWRAITKDPVLFDKFHRVWHNSGSKKKAIVAVARKLTVRIRALEIKNETYVTGLVA